MNKGYLTAGRDSGSDECLTPRYAVKPILKYINNKGYKNIWCPFDKHDSFYVRELRNNGFNVKYTHIENGEDFFELKLETDIDCIVSNPPFSCKDKVLERLYELRIPFAILLPQNSLQSIKRVNLFMDNGLEYLGFDKRINFYINNNFNEWKSGNHFASGYFCKDVLPEKLMFEILEPIQEIYI